jgi:hypothetical protein
MPGLQKVAADIRAAGGTAEPAQVDALDESEVTDDARSVVATGGSLDVSPGWLTSSASPRTADGGRAVLRYSMWVTEDPCGSR